ncbi:MAG: hypothetical protein JEY99_01975 [Spirochaetales bacterium]|nr:hypothetical protein [Spirochaetales bacterium]
MNVENINSLSSISLNSIVRAKHSQGAISLPVDSSSFMYSNLKHIRGIPAFGGTPGYSMSRLRVLDNLIDRLQDLKGDDYSQERVDEAILFSDVSQLEEMTETLKNELRDVLSNRIPGFLGPSEYDTGLILNLSV